MRRWLINRPAFYTPTHTIMDLSPSLLVVVAALVGGAWSFLASRRDRSMRKVDDTTSTVTVAQAGTGMALTAWARIDELDKRTKTLEHELRRETRQRFALEMHVSRLELAMSSAGLEIPPRPPTMNGTRHEPY